MGDVLKNFDDDFSIAYARLEDAMRQKFSLSLGGIERYIKHLSCFCKGASPISLINRLNFYLSVSSKLSATPPKKSDVAWLNTFRKMINSASDPLSRYLNCR